MMTRYLCNRLTFPFRFLADLVFFLVHPAHGDPGDTAWMAWRKYRLSVWTAIKLAWGTSRC